MHSESLNTILVALPLLLILVVAVLRMDDRMFTPETRRKRDGSQRKFAVADKDGENVLTDPDGRPFGEKESRNKA
jgi:hypothetical protein